MIVVIVRSDVQPEPREHGVLESGQGSDAIAGEREDEEADSVARAAGVA
ncbi:hypothetical protein [Agromyces sp. Soil535]|nr:hypothetical protein [Agromyces sp. Soil535]